jgi:hypothetical protein
MTAFRSRLSRVALASALALGVAGLGASPAMAAAPAPAYSKAFIAAAGPLQVAIEKVKKAPSPEGIADLRAQFDKVAPLATAPDDKFAVGNFGIQIGSLAQDNAIQRKGVELMIASGKAAPDMLPKLHFYVGNFAYEAKEYAAARASLQAAVAAGYQGADPLVLLAETYFQEKQDKEGLPVLIKAIDAAGASAPEGWYRRALGAAYTINDYPAAVGIAAKLVKGYPTKQNWSAAIAVLRDLARLPSQDTIDLMRLMARTNSFAEERDYGEFVQAADARRNPGEVKAVIDAGVAAGMVDAKKTFYAEALRVAAPRIAPDKASLPGLEKDARMPNATAASVAGSADAFLSYGEGAKAADLYKLALTKANVDKPVVLTRLGIAQVDAGDYAGAQESFGKVEGARQGMALLWSTFAAQKAAGK